MRNHAHAIYNAIAHRRDDSLSLAASSAHAAPDAPSNIRFSPANPEGGLFFVTWQKNYKAEWYEIWEIDAKGTSALLGTTPFPHWQFTDHTFGTFRYEIRTCDMAKCSAIAESQWVDVGAKKVTPSTKPLESACGPADPPPKVAAAWDDYYDKIALSSTFPSRAEVGDTGVKTKPVSYGRTTFPSRGKAGNTGIKTKPLSYGPKHKHWDIGKTEAPSYDLANPESDTDGDCLPDYNDPFPLTADIDDDGWLDGPCNQRWRLVLTRMEALDEAEDWGRDETYLIVDGARFPHTNVSGDGANNDY